MTERYKYSGYQGRGALAKQLHQCLRNLRGFTDGQVQMVHCDWDNLDHLTMEVSPNGGMYKGGIYKFQVSDNVYRDYHNTM